MTFMLEDSKKFKDGAPKRGQMLVYTRQKVFFEKYEDLNDAEEIFSKNEVLEMHLFDREKEYRIVKTRSKRNPSGYIEAMIMNNDNMDTYEEIVNVDGDKKMKVINMISYGETGMISIDNYRLAMEV